MSPTCVESLSALYLEDETAWLEATAALITDGQIADLDFPHLAEYLTDMANRDRREVKSRLVALLVHLLKWQYQPKQRSGRWQSTILFQQMELADLASSGVLRGHAEAVLQPAYVSAVKLVSSETGLAAKVLPQQCPYAVSELLVLDLKAE